MDLNLKGENTGRKKASRSFYHELPGDTGGGSFKLEAMHDAQMLAAQAHSTSFPDTRRLGHLQIALVAPSFRRLSAVFR